MKTNQKIIMGNDEFILYIRKNSKCETPTYVLGGQISKWFKERNIDPIHRDVECYWETLGASVDEKYLPKTAAQFEFNRSLLPELYTHLDKLKNK